MSAVTCLSYGISLQKDMEKAARKPPHVSAQSDPGLGDMRSLTEWHACS